ncbi:LptA/OstA family protein [Treponema socranskii]|uniref:LptA/OstA family protein n=1 Tax=Treponema socranskii TaxID=53419 RepID=UPI0020A5A3A9|nr:LptA/OstA family protein [Treponema socranskii]
MRKIVRNGQIIFLLILYGIASMLPVWAERITFSANSMTGTAGNTSDTTTLSGSAYVLTSSMEIAADSITMSGKNFRYIEAEGNITGKNIETKMEFTCASLSYDRRTKIATLKDNVHLADTENGVSVEAQLIEYNQNTDIARIQIGITIKQKDNVCSCAYAVYRKKNKMLEMSGNARITQGEDTFRAQQITLNLDTQEITLDGRVKGSVVDDKSAEQDKDTKKDSAAGIDTSDKDDAPSSDGMPSGKEGGADRSGDAESGANASPGKRRTDG